MFGVSSEVVFVVGVFGFAAASASASSLLGRVGAPKSSRGRRDDPDGERMPPDMSGIKAGQTWFRGGRRLRVMEYFGSHVRLAAWNAATGEESCWFETTGHFLASEGGASLSPSGVAERQVPVEVVP